MKREEAIKQLATELQKIIIEVLDLNLRSCINCLYFKEIDETCLKYHARPPARTIAKGCKQWQYNTGEDIPF